MLEEYIEIGTDGGILQVEFESFFFVVVGMSEVGA